MGSLGPVIFEVPKGSVASFRDSVVKAGMNARTDSA